MDLSGAGKLLVVVGIGMAILGVAVVLGARLGLGRLPGDLFFSRGNIKVYVPVVTSLVLSLVLTIVLNLLLRR